MNSVKFKWKFLDAPLENIGLEKIPGSFFALQKLGQLSQRQRLGLF